jgi:hypothetical protein
MWGAAASPSPGRKKKWGTAGVCLGCDIIRGGADQLFWIALFENIGRFRTEQVFLDSRHSLDNEGKGIGSYLVIIPACLESV